MSGVVCFFKLFVHLFPLISTGNQEYTVVIVYCNCILYKNCNNIVLQVFVIEQCHEFNILMGCIPVYTNNKLNQKKNLLYSKGKLHLRTGCEGLEDEQKYSSTLCLIFVLVGMCDKHHALPPGKRPGTHCTGCWVGPMVSLDRYRESCPHQDLMPGPSCPYWVTMLTILSWPTVPNYMFHIVCGRWKASLRCA